MLNVNLWDVSLQLCESLLQFSIVFLHCSKIGQFLGNFCNSRPTVIVIVSLTAQEGLCLCPINTAVIVFSSVAQRIPLVIESIPKSNNMSGRKGKSNAPSSKKTKASLESSDARAARSVLMTRNSADPKLTLSTSPSKQSNQSSNENSKECFENRSDRKSPTRSMLEPQTNNEVPQKARITKPKAVVVNPEKRAVLPNKSVIQKTTDSHGILRRPLHKPNASSTQPLKASGATAKVRSHLGAPSSSQPLQDADGTGISVKTGSGAPNANSPAPRPPAINSPPRSRPSLRITPSVLTPSDLENAFRNIDKPLDSPETIRKIDEEIEKLKAMSLAASNSSTATKPSSNLTAAMKVPKSLFDFTVPLEDLLPITQIPPFATVRPSIITSYGSPEIESYLNEPNKLQIALSEAAKPITPPSHAHPPSEEKNSTDDEMTNASSNLTAAMKVPKSLFNFTVPKEDLLPIAEIPPFATVRPSIISSYGSPEIESYLNEPDKWQIALSEAAKPITPPSHAHPPSEEKNSTDDETTKPSSNLAAAIKVPKSLFNFDEPVEDQLPFVKIPPFATVRPSIITSYGPHEMQSYVSETELKIALPEATKPITPPSHAHPPSEEKNSTDDEFEVITMSPADEAEKYRVQTADQFANSASKQTKSNDSNNSLSSSNADSFCILGDPEI